MQRQPVVSSNIKSIGLENGVLEVEFSSGSVYQYTGPMAGQHFEALKRADSVGSYFARNIRGNSNLKATRVDAGEKA